MERRGMKSGSAMRAAMLGVWMLGSVGGGSWAVAGPPPSTPSEKTAAPLPDYGAMTVEELARDARVGKRYKNVLMRVMKRREMVFSEFELNESQANKLKMLFEEKLDRLAKIIRKGEENFAKQRERLADLGEQFSDAKLHRQQSRAMSLYKEIAMADPGPQFAYKAFVGFDSDVQRELDERQANKYRSRLHEIDKKLIDFPKPAGFSPVRIVLSEINISEAQQKEVLAINKELSPRISTAHVNRDYVMMAEVEAEFRRRCLALLSEQQLQAYLEREKKHEVEDGWEFSK